MNVGLSPGRAVGAALVVRTVLAMALGLVPTMALARSLVGHTAGDRVLWDSGGFWLLEALAGVPRVAPHLGRHVALVAAASYALSVVPLVVVVSSRSPRGTPTWTEAGAALGRAFGRLLIVGLLGLVGEVVAVVLASLTLGFALRPEVGVASELLPFVVGAVLGLGGALAIGIVADLARASVVWEDAPVWDAVLSGLETLKRHAARLYSGALLRCLAWLMGTAACASVTLALLPSYPAAAWIAVLGAAWLPLTLRSSFFADVARLR